MRAMTEVLPVWLVLYAGLLAAAGFARAAGDAPALPADWEKQSAVFRGPAGSGRFTDAAAPATWNEKAGKNVLWKTRVPMAGLASPVVWLAVVAGSLLSVLKRFFRQACALEGQGVVASIRRGWAVVRHKTVEVLVMWLIMLGVTLSWIVFIALSFVVLFPLLILFIVLGGAGGALSAYLVFLLSSLVVEGALPVLLAMVVGLPIFILVMLAPWWCLGGLMEVFKSSAWTLTYRELRAVEDAQPDQVRAMDAGSLGAAPAA